MKFLKFKKKFFEKMTTANNQGEVDCNQGLVEPLLDRPIFKIPFTFAYVAVFLLCLTGKNFLNKFY